MDAQPLPLAGVRVLDLSRLLPGPYATLVLADLGASVDKVEDPDGGEYLRQMPPQVDGVSALFTALNANKRSIALDLKAKEGNRAFHRLLPRYDVLVESFRPGVLARLGLSPAALRERHPRLIVCSISGYGQTGPDAAKAGHDLNYLARAGVLGASGPSDAPPSLPGGQFADVGGGSLFGLVGILAALFQREKTGKGALLDISMTEGVLAFRHMNLAARLALRPRPPAAPRGQDALDGGYASYNLYRTQDRRYLAVAALEPKFFQGVCERLGHPEWLAEGYDVAGGGAARTRRAMAEHFETRPLSEWVALFAGSDLCVEPVLEGDEVFEDPQLVARGAFSAETLRIPHSLPSREPGRAPSLGEHSREILEEAGLAPEELQLLLAPRR